MKRLLSIFSLTLLLASGCKKNDTPSCENWEVKETCKAKNPQTICGSQNPNIILPVCGEDLKFAHSGTPKVYREDENVIETRYYIRKVQ